MSDVKQVIILRKDLNMRKGKMVAQGAHASMAVMLNNSWMEADKNGSFLNVRVNQAMKEWLSGRFTKICVSVDSEEQLLFVHSAAENADLPCSLIQDAGLTEFDGVPTYTAVAIGPGYAEDIDKITGLLKLL